LHGHEAVLIQEATLHIRGWARPFELEGSGPWSLGRSEGSDIYFPDDPSCSRAQAIIRRAGDGLLLEPLSKVTTITLNRRAIDRPHPLMDGDIIEFAAQTISVRQRPSQGALAPSRSQSLGRIKIQDGLFVGRRDDNRAQSDRKMLVLDHPTVSRKHARFLVTDTGFAIEDLGSTNGTRVNGKRISRKTRLTAGDTISIGVFSLAFDGSSVSTRAQADGVSLTAHSITKTVQPKRASPPLTLVDRVNLEIMPGELVCIIGESGSGKSTLMNIVSGRKKPTDGSVLLGEFDIHAYFDTLKQNIAYVPQSDLLHETLTLRQALNFVALLRLPRDLSTAARKQIVEDAARNVGLEQKLDLKIVSLSGGQKKRASLATEILSHPKLLFLDEVTSGLDESTDREIMALLQRLTRRGMTIICVTHTLANIEEFADKVIVMAVGGTLTFCGAPRDMLAFFDIRHLGGVFGALDRSGANHWRERFEHKRALPLLQRHIGVPTRGATGAQAGSPGQQLNMLFHQFAVLTIRNFALLWGDKRTLLMAAVQSVIVGGLLGYAYSNFGNGSLEISNSKLSFLLVLGITCLWIGCAGAAKEIVGELSIYLRERDINLSTVAFVLSKFLVVSIFTIAQIALLMLTCGLIAAEIPGAAAEQFGLAALAAVAGAGVGLFISSISNSRDQAAVIVPLALAPQLILGSGLVTTLSSAGQWIAKLLIGAYWTREAMTAALISAESIFKIDTNSGMRVAVTAQSLPHCIAALTAQTAGWVTLTIGIMYWRHAHKTE
jgi:ABC-type multidrug transport system ATPase subunit/pSer/pThr/pTyr-binding forkhead associated (FHA) protein